MLIHSKRQERFYNGFLAASTQDPSPAYRVLSSTRIALNLMPSECFINFIFATTLGQGHARDALRRLEALSDEYRVPIALLAVPVVGHPGISDQKKLIRWYKGLDFQRDGESRMVYRPKF